jgi:methionyl-tRNA formyltransferase
MRQVQAVLLMSEESAKRVLDLARQAGIEIKATIAQSKPELIDAFSSQKDLLLSFGTGVIVPSSILDNSSLLALNVHAASPQYPGRDPHHFAVYNGAAEYGATMHYMINAVDAGPIVDVELFSVLPGIPPCELLGLANEAAWKLIERFFKKYAAHGLPQTMKDISWAQGKSTRQMFMELCRITPCMTAEEIHRRQHATKMPGYRNLYIDLAGLRFRIEETIQ